MRSVRTALIFTGALGALVSLPMTSASASPPTRTVVFNVGGFVDDQAPCPGTPIRTSFDERFTDLITYDSDGAPLVDNFHLLGVVTGTNVDTGTTVDIREDVQARFTFDGAGYVAGINGSARLDGGGIVNIQVGRLVFDAEGNVTFEAGMHDPSAFDAALCQALTS
jgi:hypothetical protein